jgi:hypothetical protein
MATRLRNLAIHARNLLDCDQASLCLYCPEAALSHPLLALFCALRVSRLALLWLVARSAG